MSHLTAEQVARTISEGRAAKRLLDNQDFQDVMNFLDVLHLSALVACPTGEANRPTRDYHHERLHAIRDILDTVASRASALDAFRDGADAEPEDDNEEI